MRTALAPTADQPTVATTLMRPSLLGGPDKLSSEGRAAVLALQGPRPGVFWFHVALNWALIAAAIGLALFAQNLLVTALVIFFVATRQMVFGLLLHEQVHRLGSRSKYADWLVNAFVVYPLFVTTVEDYAKVHLSHHKYFFTADDPDFLRKNGSDWTFPMTVWGLVKLALRDVLSLNTIALIKGKTAPKNLDEFTRRNPTPLWFRLAFFFLVAACLTVMGAWPAFLLYWVLPIVTITQLLVRWIAVIEHQYGIEGADVHDVTPLIKLKWWQKLLLPDMNFAMHVYHHHHPGVSWSNLPKVHEIYRAEGLVDESAIFNGQGAYLAYLAKGNASRGS